VFFNWDPDVLPLSSRNTRNDDDDSDEDENNMRVSEEMFSQWLKTPPRHTRTFCLFFVDNYIDWLDLGLPTGDMMVTLEPGESPYMYPDLYSLYLHRTPIRIKGVDCLLSQLCS